MSTKDLTEMAKTSPQSVREEITLEIEQRKIKGVAQENLPIVEEATISTTEKTPGPILQAEVKPEIVGVHAEWPPQPGIGQLDVEIIKKNGKNPEEFQASLYALLEKRYGITQDQVFKKVPQGKQWGTTAMLQVVVLSLEGWRREDTADFMQKQISTFIYPRLGRLCKNDIETNSFKYLSPEVVKMITKNRLQTVKWHALLYPQSPSTEQLLIELEQKIGLPRTKIFNFEGYLPSVEGKAGSGITKTDIAVRILHNKIIGRMSSEEIVRDIKPLLVDTAHPLRNNEVNVLYTKVLSPEARKKITSIPPGRRVAADQELP